MVDDKIMNIVYQWINIISYLEVLIDYCEQNSGNNSTAKIIPLLELIVKENLKLVEELEFIEI